MTPRIAIFSLLLLLPTERVAAQTAPADTFLHQYAATFRFRQGRPTSIQITPSGDAVLYLRSGPRDFVQNLYSFDPHSGQERVLLTAESVLLGAEENLSVAERARRERMRLAARGIAGYEMSRDGATLLVPLSGRLFLFDRERGKVRELTSAEGGLDPHFSFDAAQVAFTRDGDLWVTDVKRDTARRLTRHEKPEITWGEAEFVAQEEMGRMHGFWWSPDGKTIACQRTDVSGVETFHIADPAHPEKPPQSWPYPRPGRANAEVRLFLVPVRGSKPVEVPWDRQRYPYLARVVWEDGPLTVLLQNREQTEEVLLAVDAANGKSRLLLQEHDVAWLNIDEDMPRWLESGRGFLWTTEREGAWTLELRSPEGRLMRRITDPGFGYRGLVGLDPDGQHAWLKASTDPTQVHVWRVPLEGGTRAAVTSEPGLHGAVLSEKSDLWVNTLDGKNGERLQTVRAPDGTRLGALPSVAETPAMLPRLELTTVGDTIVFHAAIVRPRLFEAGKRYPVLLDVYGGPHAQTVQANAYKYLLNQWFADRGFIVVSLDGRGTPARGRAWERALRGSYIKIPLADQVAGLLSLGRRYTEMDLERTGILGWSYGAYVSALAVMRRPDVFRAGVAGAPVSDWLDYDTHYTERYIGLPDVHPESYEESSVLTSAPLLTRPLLIIHGTDDDNVYFTHSIKLCDALYRAGKPFEFVPLVGYTHMVTDPRIMEMLEERIANFFQRELGKPEPKSERRKSGKQAPP